MIKDEKITEDIKEKDIEKGKRETHKKFEKLSKEEISRLSKEAKKIPISMIISSRIHVNEDGSCLCPFHDDKTAGSFQFDDKKAYFNCFSCGVKGDGVDFIQKLENKTFPQALLDVCALGGVISKEEYKQKTGEEFTLETREYKPVIVESRLEKERGPIEINDFFYKEIQRMCELSPQHKNYLLGRGLTEKDIEKNGYFTMPIDKTKIENYLNSDSFKEKFEALLQTERISTERIPKLNSEKAVPTYYATYKNLRVPGLYTDESGRIKLSGQSGLMIPMKNENGKYDGLQTRLDKAMPDGSRYFWFTSSKYDRGATAGAPFDVNYPEIAPGKEMDKSICIMEGHFKAVEVAKVSKAICVSVQGVRNTAGIIEELDKIMIKQNQNDRASVVRIMFDMDMYKNPQVFDALKTLYNYFEQKSFTLENIGRTYVNDELEPFELPFYSDEDKVEIRPFVILQTWDPKDKGVDDYIQNGGKKLTSQLCSDFIERYENEFLPLIPNNLRSLPERERDQKELELENKFKEMFVDNPKPFETLKEAFERQRKINEEFYNRIETATSPV